ncbi:hypothetical protein [Ovoidimarina sediminis]|uniref:hypothetical protein n=1 Tax=Ovoidimarina sediminis TaxID=3079856 RepID=UPI00292DC709|nr:hypothetical protein [Rhodophyticola sp. MJ-SS7]
MKRQEERAWAKWTDPTWGNEFRSRLQAIKEEYEINPSPMRAPIEPLAALYDTEDEIRRDEEIIEAYLSDHPREARRPMARGNTHDELLNFWKSTPEGRRHVDHHEQEFSAVIAKLKAEYVGR